MGRRGPPPQPTALQLLHGNPGKRKPLDEPRPTDAPPPCPRWLDDEARKAWRQLVPELRRMGLLYKIDGHALAVYCTLWSRWKQAELFLREHGNTYPLRHRGKPCTVCTPRKPTPGCLECNGTGELPGEVKYIVQFPEVAIARQLAAELRKLQAEYGMTPSSRSRISVEGSGAGGQADPLADFLKLVGQTQQPRPRNRRLQFGNNDGDDDAG